MNSFGHLSWTSDIERKWETLFIISSSLEIVYLIEIWCEFTFLYEYCFQNRIFLVGHRDEKCSWENVVLFSKLCISFWNNNKTNSKIHRIVEL